MPLLAINEEAVREEHVAWFTESNNYEEIQLIEVVLRTYRHPQAPEHAVIQQYELKYNNPKKRKDLKKTSHLILLEAIQQTVSCINLDKT